MSGKYLKLDAFGIKNLNKEKKTSGTFSMLEKRFFELVNFANSTHKQVIIRNEATNFIFLKMKYVLSFLI